MSDDYKKNDNVTNNGLEIDESFASDLDEGIENSDFEMTTDDPSDLDDPMGEDWESENLDDLDDLDEMDLSEYEDSGSEHAERTNKKSAKGSPILKLVVVVVAAVIVGGIAINMFSGDDVQEPQIAAIDRNENVAKTDTKQIQANLNNEAEETKTASRTPPVPAPISTSATSSQENEEENNVSSINPPPRANEPLTPLPPINASAANDNTATNIDSALLENISLQLNGISDRLDIIERKQRSDTEAGNRMLQNHADRLDKQAEAMKKIIDRVEEVTGNMRVPGQGLENSGSVSSVSFDRLSTRIESLAEDIKTAQQSEVTLRQELSSRISDISADLDEISKQQKSVNKKMSDISSTISGNSSKIRKLDEILTGGHSEKVNSPENIKKLSGEILSKLDNPSVRTDNDLTVSPVKKPESQIWVLRAAQPGKAWVSRQGGKEIRVIEVGNVVEELGKISSIYYDKGKWVVEGDKAKIVK